MTEKFLIAISGPTAIGKTTLGVKLAEHFSTEIISADSRQFYREMAIGTAVPTPQELARVKHHFIQHISIEEDYSVGDYERDALKRLSEIFDRNDVAVMVGGSGLYMNAVIKGLDDFPEPRPGVREDLNRAFRESGIRALQEELRTKDPDYFREVDLQNPHRLIRALEICRSSGKPYSSFRGKKHSSRPFSTIQVGLTASRELIYDRINRRVDGMMAAGLQKEAERLFKRRHLNALNTVGYKEMFSHLEGQWTMEKAVEEIKKNTRRFAKRQLTWFRKEPGIHWFGPETPDEDILAFIHEQITHSE